MLRQSNPPACGTSRMRLRLASGPPPRIDRPVAGVPAVEKKALSGSAQRWTETAAKEYQRYRARYLANARIVS